jgi:hypothetical protein
MVKNEISVASPTTVNPAVKAAVEAAKAKDAEIKALEAKIAAEHDKLREWVGKTLVRKDGKGQGKIAEFHGRFAFGHRVAPAYRVESEPHHSIPVVVACDELDPYNVEA